MSKNEFKYRVESEYVKSFMCNGQVIVFDWSELDKGIYLTDKKEEAKSCQAQGYKVFGPGFIEKV